MTTVADIDALLAAPKTILGAASWKEEATGNAIATMVAPLAISGVTPGDLRLFASTPVHVSPQAGSAVLIYEGRPIQRMGFLPTHSHTNPFDKGVTANLRGLTLPAGMSRWHPWRANRRWPRSASDNVGAAILIEDALANFDAALAWFVQKCNVRGPLPPAPWKPRLV